MQLLGLAWAKAAPEQLRPLAQALRAEQQAGGGWSQLSRLEPDAYATGQALFALHEAGELAVTEAAYLRGAHFLRRTQLADGSWWVRTRAFPFQPYRESGFPHGKDQWISASGTAWATMALMVGMPVEKTFPSSGDR